MTSIRIAQAMTVLVTTAVMLASLMVAGCSTPPQPPTVDDSSRRPVNNPQAVDLQRCTGELAATRVSLVEANHQATRAAAMAVGAAQAVAQGVAQAVAQAAQANPERCAAAPLPLAAPTSRAPAAAGAAPATASMATSAATPGTPPNGRVFVVPFKLGSADLQLSLADAAALFEASKAAELVVVRGRTDALKDSAAETDLARRRALAAGEFLIAQGNVPRQRVRLQWQGAGDALVDGQSATQREANRRVEVETYAVAPQREALSAGQR